MHSNQFFDETMKYSSGSMSTRVKWSDLEKIKFTIPFVPEQKKIIKIISVIDESITKTQNLLDKLKTYKEFKANDLLTKGIDHTKFKKVKSFFNKDYYIPNSWKYPKFASLVKINPRTIIDTEFASYVPMDAVSTHSSKVDYFERRKVSDHSNLAKFLEYDVLFARITPSTENGKTALIENFQGVGIASSELTILRCSNRVLPKYLYYYMKSYRIRSFAISQMLGTTNRQRVPEYVFKKDLNFELPSFSEQQKISSILSKLDEQCRQLENHLFVLKAMRKNMINEKLTPPTLRKKIVR